MKIFIMVSSVQVMCAVFVLEAGICWAQSPREFYCTIPQFCADEISIDPRIQTPTVTVQPPVPTTVPTPPESCPAGYTKCSNIKCGTATVQPTTESGVVPNAAAYPWHVYLEDATGNYIGGGVLIDQYYVLTAAHKVLNATGITAKMGFLNSGNFSTVTPVRALCYKITYNPTLLTDDVALLLLHSPVNFNNNVNIICSKSVPPTTYQNLDISRGCVVTGFGQINFTATVSAPTQNLKQVFVPIVNMTICKTRLDTVLDNKAADWLDPIGEICAGGERDKDACTQDGGSPLICPDNPLVNPKVYNLVGLVLWGKNCGLENIYGVYLNVGNYWTWINNNKISMQNNQCSN